MADKDNERKAKREKKKKLLLLAQYLADSKLSKLPLFSLFIF